MDRLYTQAAFARLIGLGRSAVGNAVKNGHLGYDPSTKRIDTLHHLTLKYLQNMTPKRLSALKKKGINLPEPPPLPAEMNPEEFLGSLTKDKPSSELSVPAGTDGIPDIENINLFALSKEDADKLKVLEGISEKRLKNDELRGKLIRRSLVKKVLGKIHTVDVQEILTIPVKFAPVAAGYAGSSDPKVITKIEKKLEKELYKCLNHIKRITDEFLEKTLVQGASEQEIADVPEKK